MVSLNASRKHANRNRLRSSATVIDALSLTASRKHANRIDDSVVLCGLFVIQRGLVRLA